MADFPPPPVDTIGTSIGAAQAAQRGPNVELY